MRIRRAGTPRPRVKPRVREVAPTAGKSGKNASCGASTLAWALIAAKRLPLV